VSKGEGEGAQGRGREGVPAEEVAQGQEREGGCKGEGSPRVQEGVGGCVWESVGERVGEGVGEGAQGEGGHV
jgi:hypothetical protein